MNRKNNALKRKAIGVATCMKGHDHGQALVTFIYNTGNPLGFGVNFKYGEAADPAGELRSLTMWFSREYVYEWLKSPAPGAQLDLGETTVRWSKVYQDVITFRFPVVQLSSGEWIHPMVKLSAKFVKQFIRDTYSVIPPESEVDALQLDACIAELLKPKS